MMSLLRTRVPTPSSAACSCGLAGWPTTGPVAQAGKRPRPAPQVPHLLAPSVRNGLLVSGEASSSMSTGHRGYSLPSVALRQRSPDPGLRLLSWPSARASEIELVDGARVAPCQTDLLRRRRCRGCRVCAGSRVFDVTRGTLRLGCGGFRPSLVLVLEVPAECGRLFRAVSSSSGRELGLRRWRLQQGRPGSGLAPLCRRGRFRSHLRRRVGGGAR